MKAKQTGSIERQGLGIVQTVFEEIGFAFRQQHVDFGIDAIVELVEGELATGRLIAMQIKSGASYFDERSPEGEIVFRCDDDHASYWATSVLPVLVCLCDVESRRVSWQLVSSDTLISTGKGWKLLVPSDQVVAPSHRSLLMDIATPVVARERYTTIGPEDTSWALAKRYSYRVIVNGTASRAELAAIARQVTADGAKRRYNRNDIAAQRWGDSEAQIVHVYIALSAAENERNNYVCRSRWISDDLPEAGHPGTWGGEDVGDGVFLIWNQHHDLISDLVRESSRNKEDYLAEIVPAIDAVEECLRQIAAEADRVVAGRLSEADFASRTHAARETLWQTMNSFSDAGAAPYECSELDRQVSDLFVHGSNIWLYYSGDAFKDRSMANRMALVKSSLDGALEALPNARYELRKIR